MTPLTRSPLAGLVGAQEPRILTTPPRISSAGQEAVDLAAKAGLTLDPWQRLVLDAALGERADGSWAASHVGLIVGRQNGKGSVLEARELAGLFLLEEETIIHSAHEFKTSREHFRRMERLIKAHPHFRNRVAEFRRSHGEEAIELKSGQRLLFATRTRGGGRGFSGSVIVLDEAYNLTDDAMAALGPTLGTAENPQIWYTTSAPDKDIAPCEVISRVRARALGGEPGRLAYFEWSADVCTELCPRDCEEHEDPDDPETVRRTNPGLGLRLNPEVVDDDRVVLSREAYIRERLSVGRYVNESKSWLVIAEEHWNTLIDEESQPADDSSLSFGIAVAKDGSYGAIGVAGYRPDELTHIELTGSDGRLDYRPGTGWIVARAVELRDQWGPLCFVVDPGGPAGFLIPKLEAKGVEVLTPSTRQYAQACGDLYQSVTPRRGNTPDVRHRNQVPLNTAVASADKRKLADLWAWSRVSSADISPLEAVTLAAWGLNQKQNETPAAPPWAMYV